MKALYWIISSAVTIAGLSIMGVGAANMGKNTGEDITKTFMDTKNISIAAGDMSIKLRTDEKAEEVTVTLHNPRKNTVLEQTNGELVIKEGKATRISFMNFGSFNEPEREAIITVPANAELDDVNLHLGSGSGSEVNGLTVNTMTLDFGSGNAVLRNCGIAKDMNVRIGSGKYAMEHLTVGGMTEYTVGSGSLSLTDMQTNNFNYRGGSGSVSGNNLTVSGTSRIELASGIWDIAHFTPGSETAVQLASGTFMMGLTGEQADYSFNCKNASGITVIGEQSGKGLIMNGGDKHITSEGASGRIEFYFGDEAKTIPDDDADDDDFDMDMDD